MYSSRKRHVLKRYEVKAILYSCLCVIVQQIKCENRMQVREDPLWMVVHVIIEATMTSKLSYSVQTNLFRSWLPEEMV